MPTNDERSEVAARLRYVAEHGAPEWATTTCCIDRDAYDEGDPPNCYYCPDCEAQVVAD